jgi:hypothetical protein
MRVTTRMWMTTLTLSMASCAGGSQTVKPDEMTAAEHHEEAAREKNVAEGEATQYRPEASRPAPVGAPAAKDYLYSAPVYNPTEGHLGEAEKHRAHAREHEAAAKYLERFEEVECRNFPPSSRAACPLLGPVVRIDDIDGGVRVTFARGTRVDAVVEHMRCHYAFARARAFVDAVSCPLYFRGVEFRRGLDPLAVEITVKDAVGIRDIRARARDEAVFVRRGGQP